MTTRQLYFLQELDLTLAGIESQKSLAEKKLGAGIELGEVEATLQTGKSWLQEAATLERLERLEVEGLRQRSADLEKKLYNGSITAPKELESLQQEVTNVGGQLRQRDEAHIELELKMSESQRKCAELEQQLTTAKATWEGNQVQLRETITRLSTDLERLTAERGQLLAAVDPGQLRTYESLRKTKEGRAIAKVERGLCQACRMVLPTQQLQRLRMGRQVVLCGSCGRMLMAA